MRTPIGNCPRKYEIQINRRIDAAAVARRSALTLTRNLAGHGLGIGDLKGLSADPAGHMAAHAITLIDFDNHLATLRLGGVVLQQ